MSNSKAKKYLEMCQDAWRGRRHADGTICRAESQETCPFEKQAEKSDRELTKEAYEKARPRGENGKLKVGYANLGSTKRLETTDYGKRQALADKIIETGMNPNQFAQASGLRQTTVSGLLTGERSPLSHLKGHPTSWGKEAVAVAAALGAEPAEVFPYEAKKVLKTDYSVTQAQQSRKGVDDDEKKILDKLLDSLTRRERQVIDYRFGLKDGKPRLMDEVGEMFNVTKERIRQIEAKALRKLRNRVFGSLEDKEDLSDEDRKLVAQYKELGKEFQPISERLAERQPAKQVGIEREPTVDSKDCACKDVKKQA